MDRSFTQYDRFLRIIGGHMNFRKLLTYLTVGTAAVIPFAGAQNPTILQGSYISNVFGNSNFVLNPNAQTNVANVTTVTATVARSTTTPLVATSEFTVAIGTANGTATWATRTFDAGMKGQNCEARFSYRGFAATSKVHVKQGANTVASLNLTPATDPRIASINFPCGDLSAATTFQVTDTAILAGTNEIGGIYVGLATNMANVAQAEFVGSLTVTGCSTQYMTPVSTSSFSTAWSGTSPTGCIYTATGNLEAPTNTAKPGFKLKYDRAGTYFVHVEGTVGLGINTGAGSAGHLRIQNGSINSGESYFGDSTATTSLYTGGFKATLNYTTTGDPLFYFAAKTGTNVFNVYGITSLPLSISVYRFPSSSELVVTPERQNTFAAASWESGQSFSRSTTAEITISDGVFATNRTAYGKAQFTGTANDVAITVPQMPPGTYKIELTGRRLFVQNSTASTRDIGCYFYLKDGTNTAQAESAQYGIQFAIDGTSTATQIVRYTSVADRTFTASLASTYATATTCGVIQPKIIITPLDQPSNSALYVQGPILGSQTGAAIAASYVGQEVRSAITSFTNFPTSGQYGDATSISLTPGVWDIFATLHQTGGSSITSLLMGISSTSGNSSSGLIFGDNLLALPVIASGDTAMSIPQYRVLVTGTTTYYLKVRAAYGGTTPTYQGRISAARIN